MLTCRYHPRYQPDLPDCCITYQRFGDAELWVCNKFLFCDKSSIDLLECVYDGELLYVRTASSRYKLRGSSSNRVSILRILGYPCNHPIK